MKVCMIVPDAYVKGGIAAVVNGYRTYDFGEHCKITYIESYCDGCKWKKFAKAIHGYVLFLKEIAKDKPDIVHIHSSFGPSFYRKLPFIYLAGRKKIPVINHIHGADFDTFYGKASSVKKSLIRKNYNQCQILIALSGEWKEKLAQIVPEEKISILPNYCRIPEPAGNERRKQILFLGEIGSRKGCFDMPMILHKAFAKAGEAPVVMAGEGEIPKVKELFAKEGMPEAVAFPGWVRNEEKEILLRQSGIFLFPSYHEGMPMAVLEAMAYGMAIVTTNVGGIPELIENGVSGYLCEPGNIEQMAECVSELLLDEEKRKKFGDAARQKVMQQYSMECHIKELLKLYRQVFVRRGYDGN